MAPRKTATADDAREAYACPECTANRGEECRDRAGQPVPTHSARVDRLQRDIDAAAGQESATDNAGGAS